MRKKFKSSLIQKPKSPYQNPPAFFFQMISEFLDYNTLLKILLVAKSFNFEKIPFPTLDFGQYWLAAPPMQDFFSKLTERFSTKAKEVTQLYLLPHASLIRDFEYLPITKMQERFLKNCVNLKMLSVSIFTEETSPLSSYRFRNSLETLFLDFGAKEISSSFIHAFLADLNEDNFPLLSTVEIKGNPQLFSHIPPLKIKKLTCHSEGRTNQDAIAFDWKPIFSCMSKFQGIIELSLLDNSSYLVPLKITAEIKALDSLYALRKLDLSIDSHLSDENWPAHFSFLNDLPALRDFRMHLGRHRNRWPREEKYNNPLILPSHLKEFSLKTKGIGLPIGLLTHESFPEELKLTHLTLALHDFPLWLSHEPALQSVMKLAQKREVETVFEAISKMFALTHLSLTLSENYFPLDKTFNIKSLRNFKNFTFNILTDEDEEEKFQNTEAIIEREQNIFAIFGCVNKINIPTKFTSSNNPHAIKHAIKMIDSHSNASLALRHNMEPNMGLDSVNFYNYILKIKLAFIFIEKHIYALLFASQSVDIDMHVLLDTLLKNFKLLNSYNESLISMMQNRNNKRAWNLEYLSMPDYEYPFINYDLGVLNPSYSHCQKIEQLLKPYLEIKDENSKLKTIECLKWFIKFSSSSDSYDEHAEERETILNHADGMLPIKTLLLKNLSYTDSDYTFIAYRYLDEALSEYPVVLIHSATILEWQLEEKYEALHNFFSIFNEQKLIPAEKTIVESILNLLSEQDIEWNILFIENLESVLKTNPHLASFVAITLFYLVSTMERIKIEGEFITIEEEIKSDLSQENKFADYKKNYCFFPKKFTKFVEGFSFQNRKTFQDYLENVITCIGLKYAVFPDVWDSMEILPHNSVRDFNAVGLFKTSTKNKQMTSTNIPTLN